MFVSMAGNIGAGKTTAAHLLGDAFGLRVLEEPVVDNRFLARYYADMRRWSFTLQMEFLLRRVEHHQVVAHGADGYVQDRTLLEDPEVFAKYLHGLGNMSDSELELYLDWCRAVLPTIRQPDRIVLLTCDSVEVLLDRIGQRGRPEERSIDRAFLQGLSAYYSTFHQVCERKYKIPTISINIATTDIRTGKGRDNFIDMVGSFLETGETPSIPTQAQA